MTNFRKFLLFFIALWPFYSSGQKGPRFILPIDTPAILSGTFGEIRSNHFHTGIDFSTGGEEGKPVFASADGYISRIKISPDGFGNVLYITHPKGMVTVYAHLKEFDEKIKKYVRKEQYRKESWAIELFPDKGKIKVRQGEIIALSGNSGGSGAPHLHFEIRDEKTEEPLNPLAYLPYIKDSLKPIIRQLRIVPYPMQGVVFHADTPQTFNVIETAEGLTLDTKFPRNTLIQAFGKIGFEIAVMDKQSNHDERLGVYAVTLRIDDKNIYSYKFNRLNFANQRYVNAHIDYEAYYNQDEIYERCFRLPGNKLKMYDVDSLSDNGYLDFAEDGSHRVEIIVSDFNGNTSTLSFPLLTYSSQLDGAFLQPPPANALSLPYDRGFAVRKDNLEVTIPANATYDVYYFTDLEIKQDMNPPVTLYSSVFQIGMPQTPLQLPMEISLRPSFLPDSLRSKACIVSIGNNHKHAFEGGSWENNFVSTKTNHFGYFAITLDTTPPVFSVIPFDGKSEYRIICKDGLSGITSYRATIDDKWVLLAYDRKNDTFIIDLSDIYKGKHLLKITASDLKNNTGAFTDTFIK